MDHGNGTALRQALHEIVRLLMVLALLLAPAMFAPKPAQAMDVRLLMPVKTKPPALDFMMDDLTNGKVWRLSDLRGKVVVINFWAISCPVCRVEMPTLQEFWRRMKKMDVQVLTIHVGHTEAEVKKFVRENHLQLPVLHDPFKRVARSWGVFNLPITFVLNPDGKLAYVAFGGRNWLNPEIANMILALRPPL
jgi:peroxiredoxin